MTASAGIAPNKFLAKIASIKRRTQFVPPPHKVMAFLETLPLAKSPGVGKVTLKKCSRWVCGRRATCAVLRAANSKPFPGRYDTASMIWCAVRTNAPSKPNANASKSPQKITLPDLLSSRLPDTSPILPKTCGGKSRAKRRSLKRNACWKTYDFPASSRAH